MSTQGPHRFGQYLRASDKSENTIEAYLRDLRLFAKWFQDSNGDALAPDGITPIDVREYKVYMLQVKGFIPATVNRKLASISAFCEWARTEGLIEGNPVERISAPAQTHKQADGRFS